MVDASVWTAALTGTAAISGVLVTVVADGLKDRRRADHERAAREEERRSAAGSRRHSFELDNLLLAYDALWTLTRESAKRHSIDKRAAETNPDLGYGGTCLPEGLELDVSVSSQAVKTIRLILDDGVRTAALEAHEAMSRLGLLGVEAKIFGRRPVSLAEGEAVNFEVAVKADRALTAISDRIRELMIEG